MPGPLLPRRAPVPCRDRRARASAWRPRGHGVRGACAARSLRSAGRDADAELPTVKRAAEKASRCVWAWCMQQCTAFSGQVSARWIMGPARRQPCTAHVEKRRGRQRGTAHRSTRTWMPIDAAQQRRLSVVCRCAFSRASCDGRRWAHAACSGMATAT